jgi:hypothetical protein
MASIDVTERALSFYFLDSTSSLLTFDLATIFTFFFITLFNVVKSITGILSFSFFIKNIISAEHQQLVSLHSRLIEKLDVFPPFLPEK